MTILRRHDGQTLIETAIILFLLLLILLGISEFARAWFVKNSMKNAARQGARVGAVTPNSGLTTSNYSCNTTITCPSAEPIENAVCCQPGVPKKIENLTSFTLTCIDKDSPFNNKACTTIEPGDVIRIDGTTRFFFILGGAPWPWPDFVDMPANASMRYE